MSAQIFAAVKGLQLVVEPPIDSVTGQVRDDLSGIKVWYSTTNNIDTTTAPQLQSDGLNIFIPNLIPSTLYYIKYALISYLDEAQYNDSELLQATPLSGAVTVDLTVGTQTFTYTAEGINPSPASTLITATTQNAVGTIYYEFILNGTVVQNNNSSTYLYTPQTSYDNMPQQIVVKVREGSNNSTVLAQDTLTLIGIKPGINAIVGYLTNESAIISTAADGTGGVYNNAGGTFRILDGITDKTGSNVTYTVSSTSPGLNIEINSQGIYGNISLDSNTDSGTATLQAVYNNVIIQKQYSINKSKTGPKGEDGQGAYSVFLQTNSQTIVYTANGITPLPATINLSVGILNSLGQTVAASSDPNWDYTYYFSLTNSSSQNIANQDGSSNTYEFTPPANYSNDSVLVSVLVRRTPKGQTAPQYILGADQISLIYIKPGAPGIKGTDAIVGYLTNESATISTAADGTGGVYTNAGGTFKILDGIIDKTGNNVTYTVSSISSGLNIEINSQGIYGNISLDSNTDNGSAILQAVYNNVVIQKEYSISKSKTGSKGEDGQGAYTVFLETNSQTIVYTATGVYPSPSLIILTASVLDSLGEVVSTSSDPNWDYGYYFILKDLIGDTIDEQSGSSNTYQYTPPANYINDSVLVSVAVVRTPKGQTAPQYILGADQISLIYIKPGAPGIDGEQAIAVTVSNPTHTFTANNTGAISTYVGSGTNIRVYAGATELTYNPNGYSPGYWTIEASGTGITPSTPSLTGIYATYSDHSGMADTADTASIVYTITGTTSDGVVFNTTKNQTFSKSKEGDKGDKGDDGNDGEGAYSVILLSSTQSIVYDITGQIPTPTTVAYSVTILDPSGNPFNYSNDPLWNYTFSFFISINDDPTFTPVQSGVNNIYLYNAPSGYSSNSILVSVQVLKTSTDPNNPQFAFIGVDQTNLIYVKPSQDGKDAITSTISNRTHIFTASNTGVVSTYVGSGTNIRVYSGATELTYDGIGTANNTWKVVADNSGITPSTPSVTNGYALYDDHSGMADTTDNAIIIYYITGVSQGIPFNLTQTQTFSKSKKGNTGNNGITTKTILIYKRSTTIAPPTIPAAPSDGSIDYSTGAITAPSGWSTTIPTGTGIIYVSKTTVSYIATFGSATLSGWLDPVPYTQSLDNGATYTYNEISHTSEYTPNIQTITIYTKTQNNGNIPDTPSEGQIVLGIIGVEPTVTTPTNWYLNKSLLEQGDTTQNIIWTSTVTIVSEDDITTYTPTWSAPLYEYIPQGQIGPARLFTKVPLFAVGAGGVIYKSTNGTFISGSQLVTATSSYGTIIFKSIAVSTDSQRVCAVGWVGSTRGILYISTNGGTTWSEVASNLSTNKFNDVIYVESLDLFIAVGNSGTIVTSTNLTTWTQRAGGSSVDYNKLASTTPGTIQTVIHVVGTSGTRVRSSDGITWTTSLFASPSTLLGITYNPVTLKFYILGFITNTIVYESTNNSLNSTWGTAVQVGGNILPTNIKSNSSGNMLITCQQNTVITTTNSGTTWKSVTVGTSNTEIFWGITSIADEFYISSSLEQVYTSSDGGYTWKKSLVGSAINIDVLYNIGTPYATTGSIGTSISAAEIYSIFNRYTAQHGDVLIVAYSDRFLAIRYENGSWSIVEKFIDGNLVVDGSITTNHLAANSISSNKIVAEAITTEKLAANSITAAKINANAVTADKINANAVTADKIATNLLSSDNVVTRNLTVRDNTGAIILDSNTALNSTYIATAAVGTLKIAGNAVTIPSGNAATGLNATVTITLDYAAPVIIIATFYGQQISWYRPRVWRSTLGANTLILAPTGLQSSGGVDPYLPITITGTDNPGVGTHTYFLDAYYEAYAGRPLSTETTIFVLGAKR